MERVHKIHYLNLIILSFNILFFSNNLLAQLNTKTKLVASELAKYHGPEWILLQKNSGIKKSEIKTELRKIILEHEKYIGEYDLDLRSFLFRNAVISYGQMIEQKKSNGEVPVDDLKILDDLYQNPQQFLRGMYSGDDRKFFAYKPLEGLKNTGSPDALELYSSYLNEETPAYLVEIMAKNTLEIIQGNQDNPAKYSEGSLQFVEPYFPNLKGPLKERVQLSKDEYKNILKKMKDSFSNSKMIQKNLAYKSVMKAINQLNETINLELKEDNINKPSSNNNKTSSKDNDGINKSGRSISNINHDHYHENNNEKKNHEIKREIASEEEIKNQNSNSEESTSKIFFILGIFFIFLSVLFYLRKNKN